MVRTKLSVLLLSTALVLVGTSPGYAQLGGAIRRKIGDAVKGPDKSKDKAKSPPGAETQGIQFNARVVELTKPVVSGLMKGLELEIALLTEFAKVLEPYKTVEQYDACKEEVAQTPESQAIAAQYANRPDNATAEQMQRLSEKMDSDWKALYKKKCGTSIEEEWPNQARDEKTAGFHRQAAAAAGLLLVAQPHRDSDGAAVKDAPAISTAQEPVSAEHFDHSATGLLEQRLSSTRTGELKGSASDDEAVEMTLTQQGSMQQQGSSQQGSSQQNGQQGSAPQGSAPEGSTAPYDISQERIDAYCEYKKVAPPSIFPLQKGYNLGFDGSRVGMKDAKFYYTAAEVEALEEMGCVKLTMTIGKIQQLIEMPPIRIQGRGPIKTKR